MDVLKCAVLVTMMTLSSCAKLNYIVEQGIGQYDLLTASRPNEVYLNDPEIPEEIKQKISYVEKARDHFSKYWESEKQRTYSRTTLLNRKAVSYLVISSPTSRIKAQDRCFWFVGCFPYIGFFSEDSAREFAEEIENNEVETYMRPVYAYSSLGYFEDPILSSFFVFDRVELTELVFHELYHLYFFVKNEVELNENLAQFVAQKMTEKYFDLPDGTRENSNNIYEEMKKALVDFTQKLQYKYEEMREQNRNDFKKQRELFIENEFRPFFQEFCEKNGVEGRACFPLYGEWNNARLAAFLTYQKRSQELSELYQSQGRDLRSFQLYIQKKYEQYKSEKMDQSFSDFLFSLEK